MMQIDREELKRWMDERHDFALIEALPERYYADAHLPGALRLNHDEVDTRAAQLLPDRQRPVVVYCASAQCRNSHQAAQALLSLGYRDVRVYAGGKQDWTDAGLPTDVGHSQQAA